jgi:hypothetical protein
MSRGKKQGLDMPDKCVVREGKSIEGTPWNAPSADSSSLKKSIVLNVESTSPEPCNFEEEKPW